jgi:putative flippase GtrA
MPPERPAGARNLAVQELARFVAVGLLNTVFGYAIFLLGLRVMGWPASVANTLSYAVSLCLAFVLTRRFVFRKVSGSSGATAWRFLVSFAIAFAINQAVLWLLLAVDLRPEIAQLGAMVSYTCVFFILNKFFVFRRASAPS